MTPECNFIPTSTFVHVRHAHHWDGITFTIPLYTCVHMKPFLPSSLITHPAYLLKLKEAYASRNFTSVTNTTLYIHNTCTSQLVQVVYRA